MDPGFFGAGRLDLEDAAAEAVEKVSRAFHAQPTTPGSLSFVSPQAGLPEQGELFPNPLETPELPDRHTELGIAVRQALLEALQHSCVPLLSIDRLAEALRHYRKERLRSRDALIRFGWPASSHSFRWLDLSLSPCYPTRLPVSAFRISPASGSDEESTPGVWESFQLRDNSLLPQDSEGNYCFDYSWSTGQWEDEVSPTSPDLCAYEAAPLLPGLTSEIAARLEDLRDGVLRLKLEVLDICIAALEGRTPEIIWPAVSECFTSALSPEELTLLLEVDFLYETEGVFWQWTRLTGEEIPLSFNGGVTDLLKVAGHCEKELRNRSLDAAAWVLGRCRNGDVTGHLVEDGLQLFWRCLQLDGLFWDEFTGRVNRRFADEYQALTVKTGATLALGGLFERLAHLEGGGIPRSTSSEPPRSSRPELPRYLFRRHGPAWWIVFDGEPWSLPDSKPVRVIALLLQHPERTIAPQILERLADGSIASPETLLASLSTPEHGGVILRGSAEAQTMDELGLRAEDDYEKDPVLDRQAVTQLRSTLERLQTQAASKRTLGDIAGAVALEQNAAEIARHLDRGRGRHGRTRSFGGARSAAAGRLATAKSTFLRKTSLPSNLREHLRLYVHVGEQCCYAPPKLLPWEF